MATPEENKDLQLIERARVIFKSKEWADINEFQQTLIQDACFPADAAVDFAGIVWNEEPAQGDDAQDEDASLESDPEPEQPPPPPEDDADENIDVEN